MFFFGSRVKEVSHSPLFHECNNCKTNKQLARVYVVYLTTFFIPTSPMWKTATLECEHCKKLLLNADLPDSLLPVIKKLKSAARFPFYTYIGLILFLWFLVELNGGLI